MYKPEKKDYRAQETYDLLKTKRYSLKLNKKTDADIIAYIDGQKSAQGAIRRAIRAYLETGGK